MLTANVFLVASNEGRPFLPVNNSKPILVKQHKYFVGICNHTMTKCLIMLVWNFNWLCNWFWALRVLWNMLLLKRFSLQVCSIYIMETLYSVLFLSFFKSLNLNEWTGQVMALPFFHAALLQYYVVTNKLREWGT